MKEKRLVWMLFGLPWERKLETELKKPDEDPENCWNASQSVCCHRM